VRTGDATLGPSGAPVSLGAAMDWLRSHFRPASARGLSAVVQLRLSGSGGGPVRVRIADGRLDVEEAEDPGADLRLELPARDFFGILAGSENPDLLYMAGRLEIEGDLALAMKMRILFRAPA
jgi:putative sterol carrier protein